LAFDALMERYSRNDVAVLMYHLHIPVLDPMANPSTLARAKSLGVTGTPSFAIDGKKEVGGAGRDETKSYYDKLNALVEQRLQEPAQARLSLNASLQDGVVKVRAGVAGVKSASSDLRVHIALVEEHLSYSGQNGVRFHPMVVRSLAGKDAAGFAVNGSKRVTVEHVFDLAKIAAESKTHLEAMEKEYDTTIYQKKHEIEPGALSVVAFVQDAKSGEVLQASSVNVRRHL
jgi:hypothetical protein